MAIGYQGKTTVDSGVYYAPYIPVSQHSGWKGLLNSLTTDANYLSECPNCEKIEQVMKLYYPGNYRITSYLDHNTMMYKFELLFDTPEDRTVFLLKWT